MISTKYCYDESPCELDKPCDYCMIYLVQCEGYSEEDAREIVTAYENRKELGIDVRFKTNNTERVEKDVVSQDNPDPNEVP